MTNTTQKPPQAYKDTTNNWNVAFHKGPVAKYQAHHKNNWNVPMNKIKGATGPAAPYTKYKTP